MCERSSFSHRRRKGTAAATFVIYEGSKDEVANQVNALLDGGAKIMQTEMTISSTELDYAVVSVFFVANYFHPVMEEDQEPDDRTDRVEPEMETVTEEQIVSSEEETKFESVDLSKAEDIVESE